MNRIILHAVPKALAQIDSQENGDQNDVQCKKCADSAARLGELGAAVQFVTTDGYA